jgi:carboxylesterase type B
MNGWDRARAFGDQFFTCPLRRMLRVRPNKPTSYMYRWNHVPSWIVCPGPWYIAGYLFAPLLAFITVYDDRCQNVPLGVYHASELFSEFGNPVPGTTFTSQEIVLSQQMIDAWYVYVCMCV